MLEALKIVKGVISEKDFVPALAHYRIYNGRIQGSDGNIVIDAPVEEVEHLDITVPAAKFLKAVEGCTGEPTIKMINDDTIQVKKRKFSSRIKVLPNQEYPLKERSKGKARKPPANFLDVLYTLRPFIGDDASRPWACSVLFQGGYAYATNNVILARTKCEWLQGDKFVMLPSKAIDELLRLDELPTKAMMDDVSITLEYDDDYWVRSQLIVGQWPDVAPMFKGTRKKVLDGMYDAAKQVAQFCSGDKLPVIELKENMLRTSNDNNTAEAEFQFPCGVEACFHADYLLKVLSVAEYFDPSRYPEPCPFKGSGVDGLIIGVRKRT